MSIGTGNVVTEKHPHMCLNREYRSILEENNLLNFDRLYAFNGGTLVKQIKYRNVTRLEVCSGDGNIVFYLKRHVEARIGPLDAITSRLNGRSFSPGMAEFQNICDFRNKGIPTLSPVAAGERKTGFFRYESFLVTEDTAPYISLEAIISNNPERLKGSRKKRIITAIARLAHKMHSQGFNHRDFNATHVLISPENFEGKSNLALFDLQRVDRKKWLRLKWRIKTMAELFYTMKEPLFDDDDRRLLFKSYRKTLGNSLWDRFQLFWISRKAMRIKRHTQKIMVRRQKAKADILR